MPTITTKAELVDLLFQELKRSPPLTMVPPGFLLVVGGVCYGLINRSCKAPPVYLSSILDRDWGGQEGTECGVKLVEFARSLARAGVLDTPRAWTRSRLIRKMLAALNSDGLQIRKQSNPVGSYVVSTRSFAARRDLTVRVRLGSTKGRSSQSMFGGPTDFHKLRLAELHERVRASEDTANRLRAEKEMAEQRSADLEAHLLQAQESVRREQQSVADLQVELRRAQNTIRWQEQKLAAASTGSGHPVYRRVGLNEGCPDFLVKAARTAWRKHLHPDPRPALEKEEAERRFKEAEGVFDTIYQLRGLQ